MCGIGTLFDVELLVAIGEVALDTLRRSVTK